MSYFYLSINFCLLKINRIKIKLTGMSPVENRLQSSQLDVLLFRLAYEGQDIFSEKDCHNYIRLLAEKISFDLFNK